MSQLISRSAIVTGGARGIGAATVAALAKAGFGVVAADLLVPEGEALAAELGAGTAFRKLDVTEEADWRRVADDAEALFGPLGIVINNAGILDEPGMGGIETETPALFRHVIDVNLYGAWLGMHVTAPLLRGAGGGVIVNVSSTAGLIGYGGIGGYVASKWGLRGLTKAAALELGSAGIRVCSVHPGPIHTPMTAGLGQAAVAGQPLPRYGEPEEVAALIRFLATEAAFCTGSEFAIDGGATAGAIFAQTTEEEE